LYSYGYTGDKNTTWTSSYAEITGRDVIGPTGTPNPNIANIRNNYEFTQMQGIAIQNQAYYWVFIICVFVCNLILLLC
jgi:hypothetical protein